MALGSMEIKRKKPGRHHDGSGLYLEVKESGARSWSFCYEFRGRKRQMGLGGYPLVGLALARERARKAKLQLLDGIDPLVAKQAARQAHMLEAFKVLTFEEASLRYYKTHVEGHGKNAKAQAQFLSTLRQYAFREIGGLALKDITSGHVRRVIEPEWSRVPETMHRVRQRIEKVLNWAIGMEYRAGPNPAAWVGNLKDVMPPRVKKAVHHAALAYTDLPAFMVELATKEGIAARALEFTILTAARTGEVIGATWDEIDLKARCWTVPAGRIKAGKEHKVPLSDRAVAILKSLPREKGSEHVFLGAQTGRPLSDMAMSVLLKRMGRDTITVHGMRSCFRDWAAERTNYPKEVAEMALAHAISDKVEAAYRRGNLYEKRTRMMEEWARYATGPVPEGKIIAMR